MEIAPDTRMGLVELSVSDLDRSLEYWQDTVGLRVPSRENGTAELGVDEPLVRLVEEPGATSAHGYTGLFHVALLVPDRPSLGRFLAHVVRDDIPVTGLSDHVVSEAIYLRDPDYHGIEIYADRPRETYEGRVAETMTTIRSTPTRCSPKPATPTSMGCPRGRRSVTSTSASTTSTRSSASTAAQAGHGRDLRRLLLKSGRGCWCSRVGARLLGGEPAGARSMADIHLLVAEGGGPALHAALVTRPGYAPGSLARRLATCHRWFERGACRWRSTFG